MNIENSNSVTLDELRIEMAVSSGIIIESGNLFGEIPGWGISMVSKKGLAYLLRFEMRADSYQHGRGSAFVQW
ncbi:MAG: hypothetical protein GY790_03295 [Bacteroidetes bacterium]|nr:hypothetical protein [Bacteroidota bacterium]